MKKIDKQIITLYKIGDDNQQRQYSADSGGCHGIATVRKDTLDYRYEGDDLGQFNDFVKETMIRSIRLDKQLPDKFSYGFG